MFWCVVVALFCAAVPYHFSSSHCPVDPQLKAVPKAPCRKTPFPSTFPSYVCPSLSCHYDRSENTNGVGKKAFSAPTRSSSVGRWPRPQQTLEWNERFRSLRAETRRYSWQRCCHTAHTPQQRSVVSRPSEQPRSPLAARQRGCLGTSLTRKDG
jgi:hypothetical protein